VLPFITKAAAPLCSGLLRKKLKFKENIMTQELSINAQAARVSQQAQFPDAESKANQVKSSVEALTADKTAADKTAADKTAADKTAADKTAADKTTSDNVNVNAKEKVNKGTELNRDQLEVMAVNLEEFMSGLGKNLEFSVDQDSGRDVIKVFEKSTGDLIRQYPSEEVLGLMSKLADSAGILLTTKV